MQTDDIRFGNGIHVPYTSPERRAARRKNIILTSVKYLVAAVLVVFFLFPYVFMLCKSVMQPWEVNGSVAVHLFPKDITFKNYDIITKFFRNLGNTFIVIAINAIFIPLSACFVAYPLARHKFTGKKTMFAIIMSTVMIPTSVLMVPQYTLYTQFGLTKKLVSLWIGAFWGGGALNIFLVIQFMRVLPKEMDAAAKIDGANEFQIFARIVLPLCANIVLLIAINTVIGMWMDFQGPLVYLRGAPDKYTVGLAFYIMFNKDGSDFAAVSAQLMSMCVIMTLLPILLFIAFQDRMIGGIKVGGVKG